MKKAIEIACIDSMSFINLIICLFDTQRTIAICVSFHLWFMKIILIQINDTTDFFIVLSDSQMTNKQIRASDKLFSLFIRNIQS